MITVSPVELYQFLLQKGIKYLYHANTVTTACTFIEQGGLLSRGSVQRRGLKQTSQSSDALDKRYNVWDDIFLDVFDLHGYFPRQNLYGPVCFKLKIELLLDPNLPAVGITNDNPQYWYTDDDNINYVRTVKQYADEFERNYEENTIQQKMLTIRSNDYLLPFKDYLIQIILDDPGKKAIYDAAYNTLVTALEKRDIDKSVLTKRQCGNCFCKKNYGEYEKERLDKAYVIR